MKRLQASGVIQASFAVLDPAKLGLSITLLVQVTIESEQLNLTDAMRCSFLAAAGVQQCFHVTGDVNFLLVITAATIANYEALKRRLFFHNANVKRFNTLVAMDRIKVGLPVPV